MSKSEYWFYVINTAVILLTVSYITLMFTGCTVKVLTFGTDKDYEHQDYIIGTKKTND